MPYWGSPEAPKPLSHNGETFLPRARARARMRQKFGFRVVRLEQQQLNVFSALDLQPYRKGRLNTKRLHANYNPEMTQIDETA